MTPADPIAALADNFHEAALDPARWPAALERFGDLAGGASIIFGILGPERWERMVSHVRLDTRYTVVAETRYGTVATNPLIAWFGRIPPGRLVPREAFADDRRFDRLGVVQDVFRPQRMWHIAGAPVLVEPGANAALSLVRGRDRGAFTEAELDLVAQALPHLQRAVRTALHLAAVQSRAEFAEAALDRLRLGVLLLDDTGRLLHANAAAEALLRAQDGFLLAQGALRAARPAEAARLARLVAGAARAGAEGHAALDPDAQPGGALQVTRPSGRSPLSVLVVPLRARAQGFAAGRAAAALFVSDPDLRHEPPAALLARLHGLTLAQGELALRLLRGDDLRTAAEALGISLNTAKTQLQRAFERTGTSRQSELIAALLRGPAAVLLTPDRHPNG